MTSKPSYLNHLITAAIAILVALSSSGLTGMFTLPTEVALLKQRIETLEKAQRHREWRERRQGK